MIRTRRFLTPALVLLAGLTLLTGFLVDPGPHPAAGLTGRFSPLASGAPAVVVRGVVPGRQPLQRAIGAGRIPPPPFHAEWTGTLVATRSGRHLFELVPGTGETSLVLDGRPLITRARAASESVQSIVVDLARGPHAIRIVHEQPAAPIGLHVIWQQPGEARRPLEATFDGQLFQGDLSWREYWLFRGRRLLPLAVVGLWMAAIVGAIAWAVRWFVRSPQRRDRQTPPAGGGAVAGRSRSSASPTPPRSPLPRSPLPRSPLPPSPSPLSPPRLSAPASSRRSFVPPLSVILALACGLAVWGLGWGLPAYYAWAPDEVSPATLIDAIGRGFVGGWHHLYPPLQFYVLAPLAMVLRLAAGAGWLELNDLGAVTVLYVAMRGVTVVMGLGIIATVHGLARELIDERAARLSALFAVCSLTFLYYAKTVNVDVPYLFWMMLSLRFYVRVLRQPNRRDLLWLAATATAAVCTKDQAYGFFLLMPIALAVANIRDRRRRGSASPVRDGLLDPSFALAALVVVGLATVFHLAPLNPDGVLAHLGAIRAGIYPPMAEPGLSGQIAFARLNVSLLAWTAGWPAFILACAGIALALWNRREHGLLLSLLVPVASYYLTFLAVVRYTYDRFLLGVWLVLAIFAGYAASRLLAGSFGAARQSASPTPPASDGRPALPALSAPRASAWSFVRTAAVAVLLLYTLAYAISVNLMLDGDERYAVERFLRARVSPFDVVGVLGQEKYLPRLMELETLSVAEDPGRVEQFRPLFVMVNTEHPDWEPGTRALVARLDDGSLGYERELVSGRELPWWVLARGTWPLGEGRDLGITNLDKISPPIVIYTDRRR